MARKPTAKTEFVLVDVYYEDGSRRSNRRIPRSVLDGPEGETAVRHLVEAQDREIAEKSGVPMAPITSVKRSG
jgi:hypothetical protein